MIYNQEISITPIQKEKAKKLFERLKKKKPKNLDDVFHKAHTEAFKKIDCLSCANCCKTTSPIFRDIDVNRIAKKLKTSTKHFQIQYLQKDEDGDLVLKTTPCAFLGSDNKCDIYSDRPQACKEYPHTDRKKVAQVLDLTLKNMEICPAVSICVEKVVIEFE